MAVAPPLPALLPRDADPAGVAPRRRRPGIGNTRRIAARWAQFEKRSRRATSAGDRRSRVGDVPLDDRGVPRVVVCPAAGHRAARLRQTPRPAVGQSSRRSRPQSRHLAPRDESKNGNSGMPDRSCRLAIVFADCRSSRGARGRLCTATSPFSPTRGSADCDTTLRTAGRPEPVRRGCPRSGCSRRSPCSRPSVRR